MFVKLLIRVIFAIIFGFLGSKIGQESIPPNAPFPVPDYTSFIATIVFAIIGFLLPDLVRVLTRLGIGRLAEDITNRITSQMSHLPQPWQLAGSKTPLNLIKSKSKSTSSNKYLNPMIVDTSALIDGRLANVAETGFLFGSVVVLESVLSELRHIADSADDLRRMRGRMGLEVLAKLKKNKNVKVTTIKNNQNNKDVDEKIINAAKKLKAKIITCDFNLNKQAQVLHIDSLNVNELANSIKSSVLPGEIINIKIVQPGKEAKQGVGYLDDGTMVVVEGGKSYIGKTIACQVHRNIQTAAGKMLFVKPSLKIET